MDTTPYRHVLSRRSFLKLGGFAAIAAVPGCAGVGSARSLHSRLNIVFILADDLGYGDLGCYGNEITKTPHIDKLASEGVRFTNFYVTCPVCTPSRGSLLTGRYPQRNGLYDLIRNNEVNFKYQFDEVMYATSPEMTLGLDLREITIAQQLKKAGYATGIVGKWDSGRARRFLPLQRGFDFFYGFANTGIDYYTHERYGVPSLFRGNDRIKEEGYATDLFRREAVNFIRSAKDQPFFLYLPFNAPHSASNFTGDSNQAPEEYVRLYAQRPGDKKTRVRANISCLDAAVGAVLAELKTLGLDENTLVIFASDNGAGGGENTPLRGGKSQLFEGGIRVPFIAKWPGHFQPGGVSDAFCSMLDLFPTLLAAAGTRPPRGLTLDGYDLWPVLTQGVPAQRASMFWEWRYGRAARVGNWKWVEDRKGGGLFDLSTDIGEKNDLSESRPDVLQRVMGEWAAWHREMDAAEPRGPFRDY